MSTDAIKQVTETEDQVREDRIRAQAEAKTLVAKAEKEGQEALLQARRAAQAQARERMAQTEREAEARTQTVLEQYEQDCQALKNAAAEKLDEAAALIVRRVVNT